jgi:type IV secretion system protein VirB5
MWHASVKKGLPVLLVLLGIAPSAHAQWAVVDVGAIAQLVQQVKLIEQQLQTAQNELSQAQLAYQSMTGSRGMQNLLSGTNRNYLPSDWTQVLGALNGSVSTYSALSASIQTAIGANAVLTPSAVTALSPAEKTLLQSQRQNAALLQGLSQQALATTSGRFTSMQQLISAIGTARDPKAILDLQARIGAEQGMLANDQTKLQVLYQSVQAQQWALQQRTREQALSDIGSLRSLPAMGL